MRVRLIQVLCPSRHCIIGGAYESPDGGPVASEMEATREKVAVLLAAGLNPWCGICGSRDWHYEDAATAFRTLAEAMPALRQVEREQAFTREFFRAGKG